MHEMGSMRELEQTLVCTLMSEFARLQLIIGEDLTKSLTALCSELETSSEALSADLARTLNLHSDDLAFPQVKELFQKVPEVHLHEGEPTPDGAWGSQRRYRGIPPEMSPQNKLPIGIPGDDQGTLSDIISPCQQGTRGHSCPWTPGASRVPANYGRASYGPASRGYFLPRHP